MSSTTYIEWLELRARVYWRKGEDIPLDLFCEMQSEGLEVDGLHSLFIEEEEEEGVLGC